MEAENKETPKKEIKEQPESETSGSGSVMIPEEFQKKATSLVEEYKDSEPCLDFLCDMAQDARSELRRKQDEERMKKTKKGVPSTFSTEAMPDSD